jgi:LmbE family N-acetylglucosaminyl deacetylase
MKYVFISPHIDDAFLSVGGLIMKLISENKEVNIEYIFTMSGWTNPEAISGKSYGNDPIKISNLRKSEEAAIGRIIKYNYSFWDYLDNPLRRGLQNEEQQAMIDDMQLRLMRSVNKTDLFFFPIGLHHPDHILIRDLGIDLLRKGLNINFYEDMPYLTFGGYEKREFYRTVSEKGLIPESENIDFQKKSSLLLKYESQVSDSWLKDIMNYSYNVENNSYQERWWKPTGFFESTLNNHVSA